MRRTKPRFELSTLLALALWLGSGLAAAADHPIEGDALRLRDPANPAARRARFSARAEMALDVGALADPRLVGATLEVIGTGPGDGSSGVLTLAPALWKSVGNPPNLGYRFSDPTVAAGVRRLSLRPGRRGGQLVFTAKGANWPFAVQQSQEQVEVRFRLGTETFCAQFSGFAFRRNELGLVVGRYAPPPADCDVPICGNGSTEEPEECDDGGTTQGDGCDAVCDIEPVCGNGAAEGVEECDDGDLDSGDGCSAACELENASAVCAGVAAAGGTGLDAVLIANGFNSPVHLTAPRLDPNRLFVVEQAGRIRVIENGTPLAAPFLDIQSKIQCQPGCGERGLLSMAFHPDYESNGRFFVDYTDIDGNKVIARYVVTADANLADAASEQILLTIARPAGNHNGGQLAFGPDGYLYSAAGDGGGIGDPHENGQSDTTLLGKLLRIDVDVDVPPYRAVPASNPNSAAGDPLGLIWAKGLRNPWRFSFDRLSGDLYIGDVGQDAREEIDFQPASSSGGENYGWNALEGTRCFDAPPHFTNCTTARSLTTAPIHEYSHDAGPCAVTGGFAYRGCRLPDLAGTYFYADVCSDEIDTLRVVGALAQDHQTRTADLDPPGPLSIGSISSFGEDARGEIYIVDRGGEVFKIVPE